MGGTFSEPRGTYSGGGASGAADPISPMLRLLSLQNTVANTRYNQEAAAILAAQRSEATKKLIAEQEEAARNRAIQDTFGVKAESDVGFEAAPLLVRTPPAAVRQRTGGMQPPAPPSGPAPVIEAPSAEFVPPGAVETPPATPAGGTPSFALNYPLVGSREATPKSFDQSFARSDMETSRAAFQAARQAAQTGSPEARAQFPALVAEQAGVRQKVAEADIKDVEADFARPMAVLAQRGAMLDNALKSEDLRTKPLEREKLQTEITLNDQKIIDYRNNAVLRAALQDAILAGDMAAAERVSSLILGTFGTPEQLAQVYGPLGLEQKLNAARQVVETRDTVSKLHADALVAFEKGKPVNIQDGMNLLMEANYADYLLHARLNAMGLGDGTVSVAVPVQQDATIFGREWGFKSYRVPLPLAEKIVNGTLRPDTPEGRALLEQAAAATQAGGEVLGPQIPDPGALALPQGAAERAEGYRGVYSGRAEGQPVETPKIPDLSYGEAGARGQEEQRRRGIPYR